ncbi:MAG: hypothetical protein KUG70_10830 [Rhodobacteraceae bacterium]|nr:hypothetical protein [Paracoccaceae bacterium]
MKHTASLIFAFSLFSAPVLAEDKDAPGLMQRGAEMFLEGLRQEMSPALDNLQELAEQAGPSMMNFLAEMGPAFADLLDEVEDWSRYSAPEILPNGDIIIRRKPDQEIDPPSTGETDI